MNAEIQTVALLSPTGHLGPFLLDALEREGFEVTAVTRQSSTGSIPGHIRVVRVGDDYPENKVIVAFKGHDAVILSLANVALEKAQALAEASVKAGVKHLIGSFYGSNIQDRTQDFFPINVLHWNNLQHLIQLQQEDDKWSWTGIATGPLTDLSVQNNMFLIDPKAHTATILDHGQHIFTSTTRAQAALATARSLKHLSKTRNKFIYVSSFEKNLNQYLEAYKSITNVQNWEVSYVSSKEKRMQSEKAAQAGDMSAMLGLALVASAGEDYRNFFSDITELANGLLDLPVEDLEDVIRMAVSQCNQRISSRLNALE